MDTMGDSTDSRTAPADVLNAAADLLQRTEWCQGDYFKDGACCLIGAIARARFPEIGRDGYVAGVDGNALSHLENELRPFLKAATGMAFPHVWNDDSRRTKAEVIDALRRAAVLAREAATDVWAATHGR